MGINTFTRDGVSFRYPTNWQLEAEPAEDGWAVMVQSPDTAFVLISLRPDVEDPAALADEALVALRTEYPLLDADPIVASIHGQPAIGHDIDFLSLDTPIVCFTRAIHSPGGPVLLLAQTSEFDRKVHEPALRAIIASLEIEVE